MEAERDKAGSGATGIAPRIRVIALSTCFFCNKVKKMLDEHGLSYTSVDIDLLPEEERRIQLAWLREFNPEEQFPVVIINRVAIVGYQEERIKEELGKV